MKIIEQHSTRRETILFDGDYFSSLIDDIRKAHTSILLETYIFENDEAGHVLTDALCSAASRGVSIKVLVDGVGSRTWGNSLTQQLHEAGIQTRVYHPLPWIISHWRYAAHAPISWIAKILYLISKINSRNHRKVCIIDDKIAYIGSANITNHLLNTDDPTNYWRETSIKITNTVLDEIIQAYEKAWARIFSKRAKSDFFQFKRDHVLRVNYTWRRRRLLYKSLIKKLSFCNEKIWVTSAYFTPDSRLLKTLIRASKRGIDVRILLPHISDVPMSSLASATFYMALVKNNVDIYEYLPTMLHSKCIIIDDWYLIGSSNINYRSFKHDLEIDVSVQLEQSKSLLKNQYIADLEKSKKILLSDLNTIPFYKKIMGNILLKIRYLL